MSNWVTIANPCSPLKGKRGRVLGRHYGDYVEVFIPSEGAPFVVKEEEVLPWLAKGR